MMVMSSRQRQRHDISDHLVLQFAHGPDAATSDTDGELAMRTVLGGGDGAAGHDRPADVLIAMTPAVLRSALDEPGLVHPRALVIIDSDGFTQRALHRAGYGGDPVSDGTLASHDVHAVPITSLTEACLAGLAVSRRQVGRARRFFALGLVSNLFSQDVDDALDVLAGGLTSPPILVRAHAAAFRAGYHYGEMTEDFAVRHDLFDGSDADEPDAGRRARVGRYRRISGSLATAYGLLAGARRARVPLFVGSYPVTPARRILAELARHETFGVRSLAAEDDIAAALAAIGASFGGALGVTATSGPGLARMAEPLGLAVAAELPLVVVDVQRAGPGAGLPTRPEQADLLQAVFGRNGESPLVVLGASSPADCFDTAFEAVRIATRYMTPVVMLSDVTLAAAGQTWRVPALDELPCVDVRFATPTGDAGARAPRARDETTMAPPWAVPGTAGLTHRVGGQELQDGERAACRPPRDHERRIRARAEKIARIAGSLPPPEVDDPSAPDGVARTLVVGWGSTCGPLAEACATLRRSGVPVARMRLRHLHPLPGGIGPVLRRYRRVVVPELNLGQLALLLRARSSTEVVSVPQLGGTPFRAGDLVSRLGEVIVR
jgi:2-oxoglutarate ferredoxin oxidoreductase subunit alpha